jgi:hypothetical protein
MLLLVATILAHGGPPITLRVIDDAPTLATSHGYVTDELGWLCEELAGGAFATGIARTHDGGWLMSTTSGLLNSSDGCTWAETHPGVFLREVEVDDEGTVWIATPEGVYRDRKLVYAPGFSVRDHVRDGDDFYAVGYDEEGVGWLGRGPEQVELPDVAGALSLAYVASDGAAYVEVPAGLRDRLLRVGPDGVVEEVLSDVDPIMGVTQRGGSLYVTHRLEGTRWFDGDTWHEPSGEPLTCLRVEDDALWGCPEDYRTTLAVEVSGKADPASWEWQSMGDFPDVRPLDCAEGTNYAELCMPLWPVVEGELGADDEPLPPEGESDGETGMGPGLEEEAASGCAINPTRGPKALGLLILLALFRGRRRPPARNKATH